MKSYRQVVTNSWVQDTFSCRSNSKLLGLTAPVSLINVMHRLEAVETVRVTSQIVTPDGTPLGGSVEFTVRSDGTYTFKGSMRATGFPSYHFGVQAFVVSADNVRLAAMYTGYVYGTDTPGDRERDWQEDATSPIIAFQWQSIRNNPHLTYRLDASISGVTGTLYDILKIALDAVAANAALGLGGMLIVLGTELGAAAGVNVGTPGGLAGVMTTAGVVLIFGPGFVFPAIVAGVAVGKAVDSDIRYQLLQTNEIEFAQTVFADKVPYDRVLCTNLSHGGGRKFTIPSFDGSILLNLGDAFGVATTHVESGYPTQGQVFIHELTHAWQIANSSFPPGFVCDALAHLNHYDYYTGDRIKDTAWQNPWGDWFVEQQANIVDDWFGISAANWVDMNDMQSKLNTSAALNDPAFHYIRDNIRTGNT